MIGVKSVRTMQFEIKYFIIILSIVLIIGGLYFKFLYDVPDGAELTNIWVSWLLVTVGIIGIMISALLKKKVNPILTDDDESYENDLNDSKRRNDV